MLDVWKPEERVWPEQESDRRHLRSPSLQQLWAQQARVPDQIAQCPCSVGPGFVLLVLQQAHQGAAASPQLLVEAVGVECCTTGKAGSGRESGGFLRSMSGQGCHWRCLPVWIGCFNLFARNVRVSERNMRCRNCKTMSDSRTKTQAEQSQCMCCRV